MRIGAETQVRERNKDEENSMSRMISLKRKILMAAAVCALILCFGGSFCYADEVVVPNDLNNNGVADDIDAQIEAQNRAAEEAKLQAEAQIEAQKKAAEDARLKAEAEVQAKQREIEAEKNRIEAEKKAREDEIARKKAEEEARKAAEEAQKKFEESLTASGMSESDFNALCKIVEAEDGHDTIEGRIGIANVILNRVRHPSYPNSIMGVLTAPGQFGPVRNGAFAAAVPSASTINAVKQAISGSNTVGGALYFHRGAGWGGRTLVATAGAHCFYV